jgi:hypothetical protein
MAVNTEEGKVGTVDELVVDSIDKEAVGALPALPVKRH